MRSVNAPFKRFLHWLRIRKSIARQSTQNAWGLPELVNGVLAHQDELDAQIESKLAPGWTLSRLARPDLVILRLALYELEYTQVPNAVAINEALRLAHDFSDEKSYRFINGVLGSIESEQN